MDGGPLGVVARVSAVDQPASIFGSRFATCAERRRRTPLSPRAASRLRERVGESIYGEDDDDLAAVVLELCRERRLTIGVAESCTGGLLGARLTAIPGRATSCSAA